MNTENNPFCCQDVEENCKTIILKKDIANQLTEDEILYHITETFRIERSSSGVLKRITPSNDVIDILANQLHSLTEQLSPNTTIPDSLITLIRSLRNIAATSDTQPYIVYHTDILENIREFFHFVLNNKIDDNHALKAPLQFLINIVSSNEASARVVHKNFINIIQESLYKNYHIYECSALIYNISRFEDISSILVIEKLLQFANSENHNEYILFFMEKIISTNTFWNLYKQELCLDSKVIILEFIRDKLLSNRNANVNTSSLSILSKEFIDSVGIIFQTTQTSHNLKVNQISLILQTLSSLSSKETYLPDIQKNKDLFINVGVVLINIHNLGKSSDNCFTPVPKLSDVGNQELSQHPAFGFKADLIRFIGNMCWKSLEMQNLARTADLIPIILDCCNIDGKNPFIIQWCIFAIRNICEGNIENQKIIAGLHQEGTVSSDTLEEMGITLHTDGEQQLKIISLNDLKDRN